MSLNLTTNATSSPESADGLSPCDGPDSTALPASGPAPVPVSRFRALAKDRAKPMSAISGPLFTSSSPSAVLQRSLESRLRARMDVNGSPEFALTWKTWDMPAGEPICALRASERRTGGKGCIGWPTPEAEEARRGFQNRNNGKKGTQKSLTTVAVESLAAWPTARANDGTGDQECIGRTGGPSLKQVAGWATPRPSDDNQTRRSDASMEREIARPNRGASLAIDAYQAGQDAARFSAATEKPAAFRLNPRFSLWLMGYPAAWASCGERAMQSCQKSRRRS